MPLRGWDAPLRYAPLALDVRLPKKLMGIWTETIGIAGVGLVALYLAAKLYVVSLLYLGARLKGVVKTIAGFIVYVLFAVVLLSPLFLMIGNSHRYPVQKESWGYILFSIICFLLSVSWAIWYVFKVKINELREYGYYLSK